MKPGSISITRPTLFLLTSLLTILDFLPQLYYVNNNNNNQFSFPLWRSPIQFTDAKGVAGLGKAGGDGQGGSDKAGQQVPPEVYKALTYAGSLFLLTLSVPLILYGLNKLLNKIEDCFGCGPSSAKENEDQQAKKQNSFQQQQQQPQTNSRYLSNGNSRPSVQDKQPTLNKNHLYQNQKYHLQLMHQQPKFYNYTPMELAGESVQKASNLTDSQIQINLDQNHSPSPSTNQPIIKPFAKNIPIDSCATTNSSTHRVEQKRASPINCLSDEVGSLNQQQLDSAQTQQQRAFTISSPHL